MADRWGHSFDIWDESLLGLVAHLIVVGVSVLGSHVIDVGAKVVLHGDLADAIILGACGADTACARTRDRMDG